MEINETRWRWKKMWKSHTFGIGIRKSREGIVQTYVVESEGQILKKFPNILSTSRRTRRSLFSHWETLENFSSRFTSNAENVPDHRQLWSGFMLCSALSCSDFDNSRVFSSPPTQQQNFFDCKNSHLAFFSTFYSPRDRPKANCSNARNAQNFAISQLTLTAVSKRERKVMVNLTHELKFTKWKMWAKVALDNKWEKKLSDEPQTHHETAVDKSFIRAHFTESRARDKMRPLTRGRHDQSIASWRSL